MKFLFIDIDFSQILGILYPMKQVKSLKHNSNSLRWVSLVTAVFFAAQTFCLDVQLAWADEMVPGSSDSKTQQGTAKTPDAVAQQTGDWVETTVVKDTDSNGNKLFASGRIKSKKDPKTGDVTEYMDDDLNRVAQVTYKDGTVEKTVAYVGSTDQPKTVERYNAQGVLTQTLSYTYTKQGSKDYVDVSISGLSAGMQYGFSYLRLKDGSLQLAGMSLFSDGISSSSVMIFDASGNPNSGLGAMAAAVTGVNSTYGVWQMSGGWKFTFDSDGAVTAFHQINIYNPYVKVDAGNVRWDSKTNTFSIVNLRQSGDKYAISWSVRIAETGTGRMPHRIESVTADCVNDTTVTSGGRVDDMARSATLHYNQDGLADKFDLSVMSYQNKVLNFQQQRAQTIGYTTYNFDGKPVVRMTSIDENQFGGNTAGEAHDTRQWAKIGDTVVAVRHTYDDTRHLWRSPKHKGTISIEYEVIDGKPYAKAMTATTNGAFIGSNTGWSARYWFMPYTSTSRYDYTNEKIGGQVKTVKSVYAIQYLMANGDVVNNGYTNETTYAVVGGSVVDVDASSSGYTEQRVDGVLIFGTKTVSLNEKRYDPSIGGTYVIYKHSQKTEDTNYVDLSKSTSESNYLYIRNGYAASASKNVVIDNGVTKITQSANYESVLAENQKKYSDLWTTLKDSPLTQKKDISETDPKSGKVIQTTFINGDIKKFDADGRVTEFYEAASGTTTVYHPGTDKAKTVSLSSGIVKTYDLSGILVRQDEKTGDYVLFDSDGQKTYAFQASTGNKTEYASSGLIQKIVYGDGHVDLFDAAGKAYRQEFPNGNYQLLDPKGKVVFLYDARTGKKTEYDAASYLVKTVTLSDGTVERYAQGALVRVEYLDGAWKEVDSEGKIMRSMDKDGFDQDGFGRDGFSKQGFDRDGFGRDGFHKTTGLDRDGYDRDGYHSISGFNRQGYDKSGYDKDGYDKKLFGRDGFHKTSGLDKEGYGRDGFHSVTGYNREGFDRNGLAQDGYDQNGRDKDGFDRSGYGRDGFHKTTGLDKDGYARDGFSADGMNRAGDIRVLTSDGKLQSYFDNASKVLKEYSVQGAVVRIVYPDGRMLLHDVRGVLEFEKMPDGTLRHYTAEGKVDREDFPDKSFRLFDTSGNVVLIQNDRAILEYDSVDVQSGVGRLGKMTDRSTGEVQVYSYQGLTRAVIQREVRSSNNLLISKTIYDASGSHEYSYFEDGVTVRSIRNSDGSYQEFLKEKPAQVLNERFARPNSEGAIGYSYDSKQRKIKTIFSDDSYIITTYKDDSALPDSALNTETFFAKDNKHLRTLVYNSKGNQVRWMVTEDARSLDCFFDSCWMEDMGFDASWSSLTGGPSKVAVIEAGPADSSHAMAVAGIIQRITGQASMVTVFSAPKHAQVIDALLAAAGDGYKVINLSLEFLRSDIVSWGAELGYDTDMAIRKFKALLQAAVNTARGLGATIVAAAGNQGEDFSVLAELDGVVSVGGTDYLGRRVQTSAYGDALDFMASGYQIWSEGKIWTGTSFAAPMTTGMIAGLSLIQGASGRFDESQILGAMRSSASSVAGSGWNQFFGWGKANASKAFSSLMSGAYQLFTN